MEATARVRSAYDSARPLLERAAHDEEFQRHAKAAYDSARHIYDVLFADRTPRGLAVRLAQDRELQDELRKSVVELREAAWRLRHPPSHRMRNLLIFAGIAVAVLYNPITGPETRHWLKERMFGPEEIFEYES